MDEIDKKILISLQEDVSIPLSKLSKNNLSIGCKVDRS